PPARSPLSLHDALPIYDSTTVTDPPETLDDLLTWIEDHPGEFAYNSPSTGGSGGAFVTTVLDSYLSPEDQEALRVGYDEELQEGDRKSTRLNSSHVKIS